eukprot:6204208-Pleurochrysis_carterae.AAC.1
MQRQLTSTVAEQNRRAKVTAELKALSATRSKLDETKEKLKATNLLLHESEKHARGLAKKLMTQHKQQQQAATSTAIRTATAAESTSEA